MAGDCQRVFIFTDSCQRVFLLTDSCQRVFLFTDSCGLLVRLMIRFQTETLWLKSLKHVVSAILMSCFSYAFKRDCLSVGVYSGFVVCQRSV